MSALNQMDALVFSSRVDNYPLILCEALSIGVPVIATHSDAAREVLQSGGKTVSEEEVLQLVQLSKPEIAQAIFVPRWLSSANAVAPPTVDNRCWRSMSTSIRICSYLLLPLIYLLVNVKIAQLGESFPITIVTFLPVLLLLFLERISIKKLMIALGIGAGLTAFNYRLVSRWMPVNTSLQLCCLSIL